MKEYKFDVEMIIDHGEINIMGMNTPISTHRTFHDMNMNDLLKLMKINQIPNDVNNIKVTFVIVGKC